MVDSKECSGCRIELVKVASLPDSLIPGAEIVVRDSRGRWYMATRLGGAPHKKIAVFDERGQPITVLSLKGGHNGILNLMVGPGDTLWARDMGPRGLRYSGFDPSLRLVKSADGSSLLPGTFASAVLPTGAWVVSGPYRGFHFHLIQWHGTILQPFGVADPSDLLDISPEPRFTVSPDGGAIWTVERKTYRLERYEVRGERVFGPTAVYLRRAAWFTSPKTPAREGKQPPPPSVYRLAFSKTASPLLWSGSSLPGPGWRHWTERPPDPKPGEPRFHLRIEAIDVRKGEVLASTIFPMDAWMTDQGLVRIWRGDDAPGEGWVDIFEPKLVRR